MGVGVGVNREGGTVGQDSKKVGGGQYSGGGIKK